MLKALLHSTIDTISTVIETAPALVNDQGVEAWEMSFEGRSKWLRTAIQSLTSGSGNSYHGDVGGHTLTLAGVTATVEDGYRGLLVAWIKAAEKAVAA